MSSASTNCANGWIQHPDFWELTNFGTTTVDLCGYQFLDSNLPEIAERIADSVSIRPGESVVFVRSNELSVQDASDFRAWWGEAQLAENLQIHFFNRPGLADEGEELWLWDESTNLVDHVKFGQAPLDVGLSLTFEFNCEELGELSQVGVCGAFRSARCDDIGSPGVAPCGPVPLRFLVQPTSQTNDAGTEILFSAQACGLPRPRYQWYFNDAPRSGGGDGSGSVPIVVNYAGSGLAWKTVARPTDLLISRVSPTDEGEYYVVLDNGLERMTSMVVTLTVNILPAGPEILAPPPDQRWPELEGQPQTNLVVTPGQTAQFAVLARGYPPPTFQWSRSSDGLNFANLIGATNRTLIVPNAQTGNAGTYRVRLENPSGITNVYARLTVKPKPRLRITEAMGEANQPNLRGDWWELTNTGEEPVSLYGYRWDDSPGDIGGGPTITNNIVIQQGESVIFTEQSPGEFVQWWGEENLPPNLSILQYAANGFSEAGDSVRLWNAAATFKDDFIDSIVFSSPVPGASYWWDTDACLESEPGIVSVGGKCGAFVAVEGGDVGSPGWTRLTSPRLTSIQRERMLIRLEWKAEPGSMNRLQYANFLALPPQDTAWIDAGIYSFIGAKGIAMDAIFDNHGQQFYRLLQVAPDDCPCE